MRQIAYDLDIGYCGCNEEGVMEIEDTMTDKEIDDMVHDMALDHAASWEGDERLGWGSEDEDQDEITQQFYEGVSGSWRWVTDTE